MVKISAALSPEMVGSYYKAGASVSGKKFYYSTGAGEAGEFYGRGAAEMGIMGLEVTEERLTRLANGQDPESGLQLIKWRPEAKASEPEWVQDGSRWRSELEERFVNALERGRNPFERVAVHATKRSERTPVTPEPTVRPERTPREKVLLEMHAIARQTFVENLAGETGAGARSYLKARGIKPETWTEFGVGLSDTSGTQLVVSFR
jgi:hypothetical protein